jgi:hypothetical protein
MLCVTSWDIVAREDVERKKLTSDLVVMLGKEFGIDHATLLIADEDQPKANSEQ